MKSILIFGMVFSLVLGFVACSRGETSEVADGEIHPQEIIEREPLEQLAESQEPDSEEDPEEDPEHTHVEYRSSLEEIQDSMGFSNSHITNPLYTPHQIQISEYGYYVAMEFLSQIPTLFLDSPVPITGRSGSWERGFELEKGQFLDSRWVDNEWQEFITYEVPDLFFRRDRDSEGNPTESHGFFDRHDNGIVDVPWIWGDLYATSFRIWDFDNNGIPTITVYFAGNGHDLTSNGGTPGKIFRYVDGMYRHFEGTSDAENWWHSYYSDWSQFYFCNDNNLVRYDVGFGGRQIVWFDYVTFVNNETQFTPISIYSFTDTIEWNNCITGESDISMDLDREHHARTNLHLLPLYSMNIQLTPITPMTILPINDFRDSTTLTTTDSW